MPPYVWWFCRPSWGNKSYSYCHYNIKRYVYSPLLLLMREFGHSFAIKRAVIKDTARCFKPDIAINECVLSAVGYIDAKMLDLVIEFLAVNSTNYADKNGNSHFCSPFQSSQGLRCEDCILCPIQATEPKLQIIDIFYPGQERGRNALL